VEGNGSNRQRRRAAQLRRLHPKPLPDRDHATLNGVRPGVLLPGRTESATSTIRPSTSTPAIVTRNGSPDRASGAQRRTTANAAIGKATGHRALKRSRTQFPNVPSINVSPGSVWFAFAPSASRSRSLNLKDRMHFPQRGGAAAVVVPDLRIRGRPMRPARSKQRESGSRTLLTLSPVQPDRPSDGPQRRQ
jgi:hypothetical protein